MWLIYFGVVVSLQVDRREKLENHAVPFGSRPGNGA